MTKPLEGVRVLDLTQFESGPSCTLLLGYLGAEVIKVERPGVGEPARTQFLENLDEGDCWYFLMLNSNKKSITLNLKSDEGKTLFKKLVALADVVVENFRPGTMDRLGLGREMLQEINPRLIYASISGYGLSGKYRDYPAFDIIAQAMGGAVSCTGYPDRPPVRCGPSIGDVVGGLNLTIGALAALFHRQTTGKGELVEVSLQESILNLLRSAYQGHYHTGKPIPRIGSRYVGNCPWDTYPTSDGYVVIGALTPDQWANLCEVIGRSDMAHAPGFERSADRYWKHRDEVDGMIANWTADKPKKNVMESLVARGVPCGMVMDSAELLEDPHLLEREMIVEITHPQRGTFKQLASPVRIGDAKLEVTPAPLLGQHNEEIYSQLLGYTLEQLSELIAKKIV
ncbi:MAG: CoA transferase [Deltaproteobacteria bacterium]|nr:CoA transferase [Deltaproteobacteria bacterium]